MARQTSVVPMLDPVDEMAVRDAVDKMGNDAPADKVVDQLAHAGIDVSRQQVEKMKLIPPTNESSAPVDETEWRHHEHVSEAANARARELLDDVGSPELAKHAIDAVAEREATSKGVDAGGSTIARQQALAAELGFASYLELFEASTPVLATDAAWCVTNDRQGQWVVWNDRDLQVRQRFSSKDEAVGSVTDHGEHEPAG